MMLQLPFHNIDPVIVDLGPVQLRWYGLMYMLAFIIGYFLLKRYARERQLPISTDDLYDLLFSLILGVMIGGRLGYVLFYDLETYLQAPLEIFAIWRGGMSFHGGFLGVIVAVLILSKRKQWEFWRIADLVSVVVPVGLGLGRIGNFINGELYGRVTDLPWSIAFPDGGGLPRHPSQLYEAVLEGPVLFFILLWLFRKNYHPGTVFWGLTAFYGLFRFLVEFVREPDIHLGLYWGVLTRGQLLTLPMMLVGFALLITFARRSRPEKSQRTSKSRAR